MRDISAGPGGAGIYIQAGRRVSSGSWKMLGANQAGAAGCCGAPVWKDFATQERVDSRRMIWSGAIDAGRGPVNLYGRMEASTALERGI